MRDDTDATHTLDAQLTESAELAHVMGSDERDCVERHRPPV
ncbi:hypothetical protein N825_32170 [Skermanella stibiiresistens SB22]|uniref:Uncharacterized protein n=1 Tax=Skermanella stibiiresistens SB22 TaxID=1385369 RepID=W9GWU5_9PROT|nr:hypothetical protein [Skermanella stibiiresistens]EWY35958.1 hypothetical protein N825_32170 [Skermanella stibiiresistens SB22]